MSIIAIGKIGDYTRTPVKFCYNSETHITAAINNDGETLADYPCKNETEALYYWRQDRYVSVDTICA
jgi:hypothetical protein